MARSPIILIQSCAADREPGSRQDAARETWLREWGWMVQHRFVLGAGNFERREDELVMPRLRDDYYGTPWKTQAALLWGLVNGYERIFHCAVDTWVNVPALLETNYERADYIGHRCDEGHASGGNGYWVSRRAAECIVKAAPRETWEDLWAGEVLMRNNILVTHDPAYGDGTITRHAMTVDKMREYHK